MARPFGCMAFLFFLYPTIVSIVLNRFDCLKVNILANNHILRLNVQCGGSKNISGLSRNATFSLKKDSLHSWVRI